MGSSDQSKKNEIGNAHNTHGGRRDAEVLVGKPEEKRCFENTGTDGRIIVKWIFRKWDGGMDWIDMTLNRNRWQVLVNAVMNCLV
jgi:hypothetical protein